MSEYNIIASTSEATVVSEYIPTVDTSNHYQSEAQLEEQFIKDLCSIGYTYLDIHEENDLLINLRHQLEKLNNTSFSDDEWDQLYNDKISNNNLGIKEKTKIIQQDYIFELHRDDGSLVNIYLIDKDNIHNNSMQVINQYEENKGNHDTRYDVTVLVNGIPLVHIELKRRGVPIREAFNQIKRYQRDSFWAGCGLYEFVQIFVISNGTHTKYFSNTTREAHIAEMSKKGGSKKKTSHSFEFTSYWADANNNIIAELTDFTKTFFTKHTILNILTKYCVYTSEELLLVMRPYQIVAAERILNRIQIATNYKKYGTRDAGGYIWHTTGSGKTLTSFKTAQLATQLDDIEKVVFVVDRKDLDYQTMKEYDRFEKGAANGNKSTKVLTRQLEDDNVKIIVTTIQKLDKFIAKNKTHPIYNKKVVLIFDECHRSQFGSMHMHIIKSFKKYYIFGFTGTPIFSKNAGAGKIVNLVTTSQAFGDKLHTYTIVNAINDGNVLPFRIDYINTLKYKGKTDKQVSAIDTKTVLQAPERVSDITRYILDHFDQKTKRSTSYSLKGRRVLGFNSIFAVESIPMAMKYYNEFKRQIKDRNSDLKIATIFSFNPNEEDPDDIFTDEELDTSTLDLTSREFLDNAIMDYNIQFQTNFDSSGDKFQNYYKDIAQRMKNKEIDLLIVVNMFLTGFDATTLNTLWVDKNLKMHGLIQAFSRTNRILNSVKTYGNIVCFRNLEKETEEAIALFGDKDARGIVLLKDFDSYMNGYTDEKGINHIGYKDYVDELLSKYPLPMNLVTDKDKKEFIKLFGVILKLRNILSCFDKFEKEDILSIRDMQNYQSEYIDLYDEFRKKPSVEAESIHDDVVFEIEIVKTVQVNIDYILELIAKYHVDNCKDKQIIANISKSIDSSIQLRSKKELIMQFIDKVNNASAVNEEWKNYIQEKSDAQLNEIITEEKLKEDKTKSFIYKSLHDGELKTVGTDIDMILPNISRFGGKRAKVKERVTEKLLKFFDIYADLL